MTAKGFSPKVRDLIWVRDHGRCAWCGQPFGEYGYELHHRRPRGRGGSRLDWVNLPGNGVFLHSTCHSVIESQRAGAVEDGFLVSMNGRARSCEVEIVHAVHGRCKLNDDGTVAR